MAVTDDQKVNILAESILTNFTEYTRANDSYDEEDEIINSTVNTFLAPHPTIETAYPPEIISYIKNSNSKKAPGKDGISNRMTKNFPLKVILILTILINKILTLNHFPKARKEAIIFPILKPGKNSKLPSSYRPIFLLSTLSKITESIILTRLKIFVYTNNVINPNQYGFTNKLSTLHPLPKLTEAISEGFQKKKSTGVVFLDIQKAFDRVWLTGLTYKLIMYNLTPPLILLHHSYNSNRSYQWDSNPRPPKWTAKNKANGLLIASTLVDLSRKTIPVRICNVTEKPRVFQKGEVLATCSPVTCVCKSSSLLLSNSPQQLTPDLLENAELSPEQKSSAERLFQEFEDVFSRNSSDIGHTTVTQHRIDTADHPPIKQHPRRLPFAKQEEVGTLLREMQENDIIEPSSSPWASQSSWFVRKMAPQDFAWTIENLTTSPRRTATLFQG
ncbi:probable RNA-directed DNA polymerase from transposon X-element [Trichonephila clavipes]|nr:probable RNA-directed DNA polymerase from transposon X-element [Trichonephila clavipes]